MTTYRTEPWPWEGEFLSKIETALYESLLATMELGSQVQAARRAGVTWEHIGEVLGTTRQGAQARFGR